MTRAAKNTANALAFVRNGLVSAFRRNPRRCLLSLEAMHEESVPFLQPLATFHLFNTDLNDVLILLV